MVLITFVVLVVETFFADFSRESLFAYADFHICAGNGKFCVEHRHADTFSCGYGIVAGRDLPDLPSVDFNGVSAAGSAAVRGRL